MTKRTFSPTPWVLVACLNLPGALVHGSDAPAQLLTELERRRENMQSVFLVRRTAIQVPDRLLESTVKLWEKRAGERWKSRVITTTTPNATEDQPGSTVQTVDVCDGRVHWRESPLQDSIVVVKSNYARQSEFEPIRELMRMGKARIGRREFVNGKPAVSLEVFGKENGVRFVARYWIGEEHGLILQSTLRRADRTKVETVTAELKVNQPIDDSQFEYRPPEGAMIIGDATPGGEAAGAAKP